MGSCNACYLTELKKRYRKRLIKVGDSWYVKGEQPTNGQGEPSALKDGTPIRFVAWFMEEAHSYDEDCRMA